MHREDTLRAAPILRAIAIPPTDATRQRCAKLSPSVCTQSPAASERESFALQARRRVVPGLHACDRHSCVPAPRFWSGLGGVRF